MVEFALYPLALGRCANGYSSLSKRYLSAQYGKQLFKRSQSQANSKYRLSKICLSLELARHYMQWAAMGAVQQVVDGELTEREAFEEIIKKYNT